MVATSDLPQGGGHPFYERLNQILGAAGFDAFVEELCAPFYARMGRPLSHPLGDRQRHVVQPPRTLMRLRHLAQGRLGHPASVSSGRTNPSGHSQRPRRGAALFRRLLSGSFIRVYGRGHSLSSAF